MLSYRRFVRILILSFMMTFFTWVFYKLVLLITGTVSPLATFGSNITSFLVIYVSIVFTLLFLTILVSIRSPYNKAREEILSAFMSNNFKIKFKILAEQNLEEKKKLENELLELCQEFESVMSARLLKNDGTFDEDWRKPLLIARKRLMDEEERLLRNNNVNFEAAIFMALMGVALPVYYIFFIGASGTESSFWTIFVSYWPIFSVVIVFEIIATFFLRAYAQTEHRIERNKNEITNIELRLAAGQLLNNKTDENKFDSLADTLSKEERNFVLGKNESSAVLDTNKLLELLSKIPKIGT